MNKNANNITLSERELWVHNACKTINVLSH